jgi:GT2 family glycosyltransferase
VKISAVIPTHSRRAEVTNAIDSALSQATQVYEILVIDDGKMRYRDMRRGMNAEPAAEHR